MIRMGLPSKSYSNRVGPCGLFHLILDCGLSHIGVLEWFEEHRTAIDFAAGTSMGVLVGGFEAKGRSPADLRTIVREVPWVTLLAGTPPFRDLWFRRREDRKAHPNLLELGLRSTGLHCRADSTRGMR